MVEARFARGFDSGADTTSILDSRCTALIYMVIDDLVLNSAEI